MKYFIVLFMSICCAFCSADQMQANPFAINFLPKADLTSEDYIEVQKQLRTIDVEPLLRQLYPANQGCTTFEDFLGRCSRGIRQILIEPERGFFPVMNLEKIGRGSDMCIVCTAPYDGVRSVLIKSIPQALQENGFNGYFLYQIGGFPNPTGKEIQYAGIPYSFKIFMMLEAYKRGFNKVLWIDSAALPLQDPTPLFDYIDQNEAFFHGWAACADYWRFILPATCQVLKDLTGTDVLNAMYLNTMVFGLKMNTARAQKLVKDFYQLVEVGTPFLSCFPEEFVLSAILGKPDYAPWKPQTFENLLKGDDSNDPAEVIRRLKKKRFFFYLRKH